MYAISNNYKNLIENNLSLSPKSKIVVDNVEYTGSVLKSYPKISHKTTNMIGGFPTKTCSFEIYDINNNLDFEGKEITVYRGLDVNGATEWIPQGIFIPTADKITTNISTKTISFNNIQDKSQSFDDKYESSLNWTTGRHTGLEIVQDICNTLGITLETTSFNWSSYNFKQPNFSANITFREVINRIAEIGGSIAYISRTGGLVIKTKTSTGHSIARKRYGKLSKEKQFGEINVVVLGRDGVDDDIVYPSTLPSNVVEWKIFDNPFVDLYREEMIETVASYVIGQSIIPFTLTDFVDGFYLDLNDTIQVTDKNDNTFNATLLNYESTSRIKSTVGTETQNNTTTDYNLAGSNKESIRIVKSQVDHINGEITQIVEEIGDRSEKSTSITQDIDSINQQVSQIETLTSDLTQNSSLTIEDAFEGEIVKFSISGNMSLLYPSDDLYPSNDLYPLDSYLIVQYKDETQDKIHLPLNYLRYLNATTYDEFIIENGQAKIIRRVGENDDGSFYALTTEIEEDKGDLVIELKEGYNKLWLESFFDLPLKYSARYVAQNDYTSLFATKVEMHSEISQTASEINLEVSKKVDENEVIAAINLTSGTTTIQANKISLEGYTTINEGFSVDEEGNMIAKNGTFTGGLITLNDNSELVSQSGNFKISNENNGRYTQLNTMGMFVNNPNGEESGSYSQQGMELYLVDGSGYNSVWITQFMAGKGSYYVPGIMLSRQGVSEGASATQITSERILTPELTQNSLAEFKKNFEKLENALKIVEETDIYKYHFKSQKDDDKKHIGFIIGDDYNYSQEITSSKNDGVDLYSMIAVCFKAIQEQELKIKKLESEVEELKK